MDANVWSISFIAVSQLSFISFQDVLGMVTLLGTGSNGVLKVTFHKQILQSVLY